MSTQQAYINGFVKRAAVYGYTPEQAWSLLKSAGPVESPTSLQMNPGAVGYGQAGSGPAHSVAPDPGSGVSAISPEMAKKLRIPIPIPPAQQAAPVPAMAPAVDPVHMNDLGRFTR